MILMLIKIDHIPGKRVQSVYPLVDVEMILMRLAKNSLSLGVIIETFHLQIPAEMILIQVVLTEAGRIREKRGQFLYPIIETFPPQVKPFFIKALMRRPVLVVANHHQGKNMPINIFFEKVA